MKRRSRPIVVLVALFGLLSASCGSDRDDSGARTTTVAMTAAATTTTAALSGNITVFAAASLTDAFNAVGAAFTKANPNAKVTFSFDASSALVTQITQGAPADLFASADTANMDKLTKASLNGAAPVAFATNRLSIIVAPGNPKRISGVADLAKTDLKVVLCADGVPCGTYAKQVLAAAKVTVRPVSMEQNVKGVVTKVTAGEADAGIVYETDVKAAGGKAAGVSIPKDINVVATYPIATVKASTHVDVDAAYIKFLTGPEGQAILATFGFGKPS
jgi:molybdate transport system substrate-binding protein